MASTGGVCLADPEGGLVVIEPIHRSEQCRFVRQARLQVGRSTRSTRISGAAETSKTIGVVSANIRGLIHSGGPARVTGLSQVIGLPDSRSVALTPDSTMRLFTPTHRSHEP